MPEEEIHQPHDKLFALGFGDPVNAAALLKAQLPSGLAEDIDWAGLKAENGHFVDPEYRKSQSDLLFSTTFRGRKCLLYLLFEHQTTEDPFMALRLLRYMVNIWWSHVRDHPKEALPIVLPMVLAQNAKPWTTRPSFAALVDLPEHLSAALRPYLPDFAFELFQLAEHEFEGLPGTPAGMLILRVMKAERLARLLDDWVWDETLINQIPLQVFELLLRYILAADVDISGFRTRIVELQNRTTRENAMTLEQQIRREGRQEGRQEGTSGLVIRQLRKKFPRVAAELTPLIERLDEERLVAFGETMLFMQSEEECREWFSRDLPGHG
jgi:predicted transposase/invertase (TIGR01784 family)